MITINIDIIDLMVFAFIGTPLIYTMRVLTEELFDARELKKKKAKANKAKANRTQVTNGRVNKSARPF